MFCQNKNQSNGLVTRAQRIDQVQLKKQPPSLTAAVLKTSRQISVLAVNLKV